jgi:hypothetical protein
MADTLSDVILAREFEARDVDGAVTTITLRLGKPYHIAESSSSLTWRCPFQISGIGPGKVREAPGMDSLDALLISLRIAEAFLRSYGIDLSRGWARTG